MTLTDWQKDRLVGYIAKGYTVAEAAMIVGCSQAEVMDALEISWEEAIGQETLPQYREDFTNGYRMALTHVTLHGTGAAYDHWWHRMVSWSKSKRAGRAPAFLRI